MDIERIKSLAETFWELGDDEQALFFSLLAMGVEDFPFASQMERVRDHDHLSPAGKRFMQIIGGDY